ncbi:MAG TPA: hypothetical protein VNN18_01830 [Candidatus Xenobia bacterium]|nr:hypothetical protein [Candidatus Xenobia bacterium]
MPVFGFNTDVKVGGLVFHVQTEDRGAANPVLDTTIYHKGRVLAKRATSYKEFLASPDFNESELRAMLERQHQQLLDEVRSGQIPEMKELAEPTPGGVAIRLMNPSTFLQGSTAVLELAVMGRKNRNPIAGARVRVRVDTGAQPHDFEGVTDSHGRATLQFVLPRLGPAGAELLIQTASPQGQDELKYSLRPRPKAASR